MPSESFAAFFIRGKALPADLSAQVSAKYTSTTGKYIVVIKVILELRLTNGSRDPTTSV